MRATLKNIPKKEKAEVAYELREAFEDESKMQMLANKLDEKGHSKSADTIERITKRFQGSIGEGLEQLTG